jgi:6,7-dimethyl-8-ribityllumazine synthase
MKDKKFAIVASLFNSSITDKLVEGAYDQLQQHQVDKEKIVVIRVPGAVEIPLTAKLLAKTQEYAAIICLGAVIRGETSHYDYVCQQVSQGCQQIMLHFDIPVIFGVLTTDNFIQAEERVGGKYGHKGKEAADAAIHMANVIEQIRY